MIVAEETYKVCTILYMVSCFIHKWIVYDLLISTLEKIKQYRLAYSRLSYCNTLISVFGAQHFTVPYKGSVTDEQPQDISDTGYENS